MVSRRLRNYHRGRSRADAGKAELVQPAQSVPPLGEAAGIQGSSVCAVCVLTLELSPQPIKLSELRQMDVRVRLTNKGRRPVTLDFPNAQRIRDLPQELDEKIVETWSDNHAFADVLGTVLINPQESIEYAETIATRELTPNKVFIAEVFFPEYPELRDAAEISDRAVSGFARAALLRLSHPSAGTSAPALHAGAAAAVGRLSARQRG